MVTFGSTSQTSTELRMYTKDLYSRLEAETGQATGFRPIGLIEVAADEGRLEEYRRVSAFNRHCGVDVHEISAREVGELFPVARTDDILAAFFTPTDGRVNPVDVTMALAKGARMRGATLLEGTPAIDVLTRDGAVVGVRTPAGDIECEYVVNAAGMWARQLGERSGVSIPLQAAEHYYLITGAMPEVDPDWPVLEDPSNFTYIRPEGDGLMVGLFETVCAPWNVGRIPEDFSFGTIAPDWDRMGPYVEAAMSRVPATLDAGIHTFFCGPESFTPDLLPVIGEAPEVRNYFVAAGLNSIGILTGGGWGRAIAHWITTGSPDIDITGVNIDRLHPYQATPRYRATRTVESLGMVYECHYPGRSMRTARGVRRSPLHERMAAQGAWFKDVSGWEGTDWFAGAGVVPVEPALTWGRPDFWEHWAAEHRAVREGVGLFDMSFMAKFEVTGPDAGALLDRLSANAVDGEPGRITYTQWLNEHGRIEADVTVTKRADGDFLVVASDTAHRHVLTWLRRHAGDARVSIADVTSGLAQITVQGPRSREVLAAVTSADLSDAAFPLPRRARDRPRVRARAGARGSPTSASSATSCSCLPRWRSPPTTRSPPRARRSACGTAGSRPWAACAWRRRTATTATTSTTPTTRSRPGWDSRSRGTSPAASSDGRLWRRRDALRPAADAAARPGAAHRSRADDGPRGGPAPRRRRGGLPAFGVLRVHPRRGGRAGDGRRRAGRGRPRGRCRVPGLGGVDGAGGQQDRSGQGVPGANVRPAQRAGPGLTRSW